MKTNERNITPVLVGCAIGVLGILTGLYIATNAREQYLLTNADTTAAATTEAPVPGTSMAPSPAEEPLSAVAEELPPLEPVVSDPMPEPEQETAAQKAEAEEATQQALQQEEPAHAEEAEATQADDIAPYEEPALPAEQEEAPVSKPDTTSQQ